jgi:lipid-binding SYLF domain-containing protein
MKGIILVLTFVWFVSPALADDKAKLEKRIGELTTQFEAMQHKPDKRVPPETLAKAKGVILMEHAKGGFIFAYQGGGGVAMVKDAKSKKWSPVAFLESSEASLGFLIGGEKSFVVILLMNTNATRMLTDSSFKFGGEARGTAGNASAGEGGTIGENENPVLVYDDRKGLYGGAEVKGGAISPDQEANHTYYGDYVTVQEILFDKKVKPTESAIKLAKKFDEYSKPPK